MAAVEVARSEKISALDALRFVAKRYLSYLLAPIFPLVIVVVFVAILFVWGLVHMIPGLGDLVDGIAWILAVLCQAIRRSDMPCLAAEVA